MDLRLLSAVRRAAAAGGAPAWSEQGGRRRRVERRESEIVRFLFPDGTVAQRDALMHDLLDGGVESKDLLSLEAVVEGLGRVPKKVWAESAANRA
jgi:hypothetical protein